MTRGQNSSSKRDDQTSSPTHPSDQHVLRKEPTGPVAENSYGESSLSKKTSVSMRDDDSPSPSHGSELSTGRKRPNPADAGSSRDARSREKENCEVESDQCCVCFCSYEEDVSGSDWLECACSRWLHEDCVEECIIDSSGTENLPT